MNPQITSIVDVVVDRSPEELIGCVLTALVLALGLAGLFLLLRRKASDPSTLIICLALGSNLVAMTVAGAYVRYRLIGGRESNPGLPPPGARFEHQREFRITTMADRILRAADRDADGFLTADEAASAAAQFVKEADEDGDGQVDEERLRVALWTRMPPAHPGMGGPPPPPDPARGTGERTGRHSREYRDPSRP
jgi:hypothetical protein